MNTWESEFNHHNKTDDLILHLHEKAKREVKILKTASLNLIETLRDIDDRRGYFYFDRSSLYEYCVKDLDLTEDVASDHIAVMRKVREVPTLGIALNNNEIAFSRARKLLPVITNENSSEWIKKAKDLTLKELQREVAGLAPETRSLERIKYISNGRVEVTLIMTEAELRDLKDAQNVLSQKRKEAVSLAKTITESAKEYKQKHDPFEKSKRALHRLVLRSQKTKEAKTLTHEVAVSVLERVKKMPASLKHEVTFRDEGQCTYLNKDGMRCENNRWLHQHHVIPKSHGGEDTLENLTTLCSGHHRLVHLNTND